MILDYRPNLISILENSAHLLSNLRPSEWAEKNRIMTSEVSPFPGPYSFNKTPYLRKIVDTCSPYHPGKKFSIMKGAQVGFSTGVIENAIGFIMAQAPGNILFLIGHDDLADEAMAKVDNMIDNSGLRPLIRPHTLRKKNQRSGDTLKSKEYPGGTLIVGPGSNHKLLRQRSVRYIFVDDFDALRASSKSDGDTLKLIEQRAASYYDKQKIYYISTPTLKGKSNIEESFLRGDQQYLFIPCPCCGDFIRLHWAVDSELNGQKFKAGITWQLDENNELIRGSVGYICQACGGFFDDSRKSELLDQAEFRPTAKSKDPNHFSFHLSSLYAPAGMYDWEYYVRWYLEACPVGQDADEVKLQSFLNLALGETYEEKSVSIKANALQNNIQPYSIGTIPDKLSVSHGNGRIVLITLAADLNGTVEDARLDWEIVAWSESGASYSVKHGSIGTFIPRENTKKFKVDRERWTYEMYSKNSVWTELDKIIAAPIPTDDGSGRTMQILFTGIDTGAYKLQAYSYLDTKPRSVIGLKGDTFGKVIRMNTSLPVFKRSKEKPGKLFILEVNYLKDDLAAQISLRWDPGNDDRQPPKYMNYPTPSDGFYLYHNYFSQYEAEVRKVDLDKNGKPVAAAWVKKNSAVQNHFFDVRIYNMALKDIWVELFCKEALKMTNPTWEDYVEIALKQIF